MLNAQYSGSSHCGVNMESKNTREPHPAKFPGIEQLVLTEHGIPIYKFSKKSGKNCGPLLEGEERDHATYDYSDEM
jgi:hypothetical protein